MWLECYICSLVTTPLRTFFWQIELSKREKRMPPKVKYPRTCEVCDRIYGSKSSFSNHRQTRDSEPSMCIRKKDLIQNVTVDEKSIAEKLAVEKEVETMKILLEKKIVGGAVDQSQITIYSGSVRERVD